MQSTDTIAASPNAVAREVNGETILLELESGTYSGLNSTGSFIWSLIEKEPHTLEQLAVLVEASFEISKPEALKDVTALAQALAENGLLAN